LIRFTCPVRSWTSVLQRSAPAGDPPAILLLGRGWHDRGADAWFVAPECHQNAEQSLAIDYIGLSTAMASRHGDRGRLDDVALNAICLEQAVHPEAVEARLMDGHDGGGRAAPLLCPPAQLGEKRAQRVTVATRDHVLRHLGTARRQGHDQPFRAAQFERHEDIRPLLAGWIDFPSVLTPARCLPPS
jgi:hypothetical protein